MEPMESTKSEKTLPGIAYLVGSLSQFAIGLHSPFLNTYLVDMGANYAELGAFRSVGNVAPTILQPAWGAISDKYGKRKPFVAFGTVTGFMMVFLFFFAATPLEMILLYGIQSILLSIQIPTWQALLSELMDESNRGKELGRLALATNAASVAATTITGFLAVMPAILPHLRTVFGIYGNIIFPTAEAWREAYYLPFLLTAILGIIASILSLRINEKEPDIKEKREFPPILKLLSHPGMFRKFCFISVFYSFAMAMAWPYFTVVQRVWLENTILEIAIASVIMSACIMISSVPFGKFSDKIGRKQLIMIGRGTLFLVPLMYAFADSVIIIYIANAIAGLCVGASFNTIIAYIYDISPEEERSSHLAVFNTFTGIIFLGGSLIAGLVGEALTPIIGEYMAVFAMLLASSILRIIGSLFYWIIKEPREYSSDIRTEVRAFLYRRRLDTETV
ncbi:MAG: MFS transporter [Candidatus Lokiarchaeota archaeon]|nr:MFS transporter [Candidatus Lokiarchaeota archaeon]